MRDDHYRKLCESVSDYDAVIDWIRDHNPASGQDGRAFSQRDDWAANVVNDCIRSVVFGDAGAHAGRGMCVAVRVSTRPELPGYRKVLLGITIMGLLRREQIVKGGDDREGEKPYILAPNTTLDLGNVVYYVETEQAVYGANTLNDAMCYWRRFSFGIEGNANTYDPSPVVNVRRVG